MGVLSLLSAFREGEKRCRLVLALPIGSAPALVVMVAMFFAESRWSSGPSS